MKPWPADHVERRPVAGLVPYARNARTHSEAQVQQIAGSIREWGWTIPVLCDDEGGIIAGHGRVLAAHLLGLPEVPVMTATGWSDAQKRAYIIADNKLALNAGWDDELLGVELAGLEADGFDLALTGFDRGELDALFGDEDDGGDVYSRKIEPPIYTPKGDQPAVGELFDDSKTQALKTAIRDADLPDEIAAFLVVAAERHTVFNFHRIADFYAQAAPEVQALFEASALVIIDLGAAIENGFVNLNDRLAGLASGQPDEVERAA